MGILRIGIFGGFRKKTGPVIGRRVNGQDIITGHHHPSTKRPTAKQIEINDKFRLLTTFLNSIATLVNMGFKYAARGKRPLNAAYAYNYDHAFVEEDDHFVINYPKMVYSRGSVETPYGVQAVLESSLEESSGSEVRSIRFSWSPQGQSAYCQYTDLGSFLVYNPVKMETITVLNAIDRYALSYAVKIPMDFEGDTVYCYMNFASANGKIMGDSAYVGAIEV